MFTSNDHGTFWALPHCCLKSQTVDIDYTILFCTRPEQELLTGFTRCCEFWWVLDPCTFCAVQFQPAWNRSPEDFFKHRATCPPLIYSRMCLHAFGRQAEGPKGRSERRGKQRSWWNTMNGAGLTTLLHRITEDWSIGRENIQQINGMNLPNLGMVGMERSKGPVGKCATGSPTTALRRNACCCNAL